MEKERGVSARPFCSHRRPGGWEIVHALNETNFSISIPGMRVCSRINYEPSLARSPLTSCQSLIYAADSLVSCAPFTPLQPPR